MRELRLANVRRQREWDVNNDITLSYRGNELAGEVGEACNLIKKLERERLGIRGSRATTEEVADELADVVICVDLIMMKLGIDLEEAVARKFNKTSEKYGLATKMTDATRRFSSPPPDRTKLDELIRSSREAFDRLSPEQQKAHREEQRKSWVVGEMMLANPELSRDEAERRYNEACDR